MQSALEQPGRAFEPCGLPDLLGVRSIWPTCRVTPRHRTAMKNPSTVISTAFGGKGVKPSRGNSPRRAEADGGAPVRRQDPHTVGGADGHRCIEKRAATQHTVKGFFI